MFCSKSIYLLKWNDAIVIYNTFTTYHNYAQGCTCTRTNTTNALQTVAIHIPIPGYVLNKPVFAPFLDNIIILRMYLHIKSYTLRLISYKNIVLGTYIFHQLTWHFHLHAYIKTHTCTHMQHKHYYFIKSSLYVLVKIGIMRNRILR